MIKTAFVTKPKWSIVTIGSNEIGICALPKIGGLMAGEQKAIEECGESLPDPLAEASLLAVKIQKFHSLPDKDLLFCFSVVSDDNWQEKEAAKIDILLENANEKTVEIKTRFEERRELFSQLRLIHWPEIIELNRKLSKATRLKRDAAIAALFRYRAVALLKDELDRAITEEDKQRTKTIRQQINRCENWSVNDTDLLHDEFKQALWAFLQEEISANPEKEDELTSEDVGKLLGAED